MACPCSFVLQHLLSPVSPSHLPLLRLLSPLLSPSRTWLHSPGRCGVWLSCGMVLNYNDCTTLSACSETLGWIVRPAGRGWKMFTPGHSLAHRPMRSGQQTPCIPVSKLALLEKVFRTLPPYQLKREVVFMLLFYSFHKHLLSSHRVPGTAGSR